jgi:hypothetical protein
MDFKEAFETYLLSEMLVLCPGRADAQVCPDNARSIVEEAGIFRTNARFADIAKAFGSAGHEFSRRSFEGQPESLRNSIEHRFPLRRWPDFEFTIFESPNGFGWGHTFSRKAGLWPPSFGNVCDLRRWSHLVPEVIDVLGPPQHREEWFPWAALVYRDASTSWTICCVFGLVQGVTTAAR